MDCSLPWPRMDYKIFCHQFINSQCGWSSWILINNLHIKLGCIWSIPLWWLVTYEIPIITPFNIRISLTWNTFSWKSIVSTFLIHYKHSIIKMTLSYGWYVDLGARSRYIGHGLASKSHRIMWTVITYPYPRYLLLVRKPSSKTRNMAVTTLHSYATDPTNEFICWHWLSQSDPGSLGLCQELVKHHIWSTRWGPDQMTFWHIDAQTMPFCRWHFSFI